MPTIDIGTVSKAAKVTIAPRTEIILVSVSLGSGGDCLRLAFSNWPQRKDLIDGVKKQCSLGNAKPMPLDRAKKFESVVSCVNIPLHRLGRREIQSRGGLIIIERVALFDNNLRGHDYYQPKQTLSKKEIDHLASEPDKIGVD